MPQVLGVVGAALSGGVGGAALGVTAGTISAGAIAINVGILVAGTLALGAVARSLQPGAARENQLDQSGNLLTSRGAVGYRDWVYGNVRKGGHLLWHGSIGGDTDTDYYTQVLAVAGHEIDGFETVYMGKESIDVATEIDGSNLVTADRFVSDAGSKLLRIALYDGTQTGADTWLVNQFPTLFTNSDAGRGCAIAVITAQIDRSPAATDPRSSEVANVWRNGFPAEITFQLRGKKVYVPGSGTQSNSTSWLFSDNPVACLADYMIWEQGVGIPSNRLDDINNLRPSASTCDDFVTVPDGAGGYTNQRRWTLNGVLSAKQSRARNVNDMLNAMMGRIVFSQGDYLVYPGAWDTPVHNLDETWVKSVRERTRTPRKERVNVVKGTFVSLNRGGREVAGLSRINTADVNSYGEQVEKSLDSPLINDPYQWQRAALATQKLAATERQWEILCKKRALEAVPNDTVFLDMSSYSISSGTGRITRMVLEPTGEITMVVDEENADVWTYTASAELTEVGSYELLNSDQNNKPAPAFNLRATPTVGGIIWEWDLSAQDEIAATALWISTDNDRDNAQIVTQTPGREFLQSSGVFVGSSYYGWAQTIGRSGLVGDWSSDVGSGVLGQSRLAGEDDIDNGAVSQIDAVDTGGNAVIVQILNSTPTELSLLRTNISSPVNGYANRAVQIIGTFLFDPSAPNPSLQYYTSIECWRVRTAGSGGGPASKSLGVRTYGLNTGLGYGDTKETSWLDLNPLAGEDYRYEIWFTHSAAGVTSSTRQSKVSRSQIRTNFIFR